LQVFVLCGGRGERLRPLTDMMPKPMVQVAGKPFLEVLIRYISSQGFSDFVLLTGYLGDVIQDHFGNGSRFGLSIQYSHENSPLGTGGSTGLAARRYACGPVMLINGDSFLPIDFSLLTRRFRDRRAATIVAYDNHDAVAPNNLRIEGNVVTACCTFSPEMNCLHAGVRVFPPEVLTGIPYAQSSIEDAVYRPLLEQRRLEGEITGTRFYDIGTRERLRLFESTALTNHWV